MGMDVALAGAVVVSVVYFGEGMVAQMNVWSLAY